MDKVRLKNFWQLFLLLSGKTTTEIACDTKQSQQNLSQKINNGTIKYIELLSILEKYGYTLQLVKIKEK